MLSFAPSALFVDDPRCEDARRSAAEAEPVVIVRPYCVKCGEWLCTSPLNADEILPIFHGQGKHQVETRGVIV